jgi:hypothetical protein
MLRAPFARAEYTLYDGDNLGCLEARAVNAKYASTANTFGIHEG